MQVFLVSYLALLDVPWMSHSLLGPVMAPPEFPVHLKAAESEGTATREEISAVIRNFQRDQGNNPDHINTEYAMNALQTLGVMFELADRPGVFCIPAHLPRKNRNEMWPKHPRKVAYVGRRVECLRKIDIFTSAFFVFFQSRLAVIVDRKAFLWKGGIKVLHDIGEESVECLAELTKYGTAVDIVARGNAKCERHCLAFLETINDILIRLLDTKSQGTQTRRYLLYPPDLEERVVEPFGFSEDEVERARRIGSQKVASKNEASGQFVEASLDELMATTRPTADEQQHPSSLVSSRQTAAGDHPQLSLAAPVKEAAADEQPKPFSSPSHGERALNEPLQPIPSQSASASAEQPSSSTSNEEAAGDQQTKTSSPFVGAVSDQRQRSSHSSKTEPSANSQLQSSSFVPPLLRAVQKRGSSRWFALGVAMGYTIAEMTVISKENVQSSDKVLATFLKKQGKAGLEEAELSLRAACREIEPPIYESVKEELAITRSLRDTVTDEDAQPSSPSSRQTLLTAVQKRGSHRWFALALSMGYNEDEITVICEEKSPDSDKLLAVFLRKRLEVGLEEAELALEVACKEIHLPIYEDVKEELEKNSDRCVATPSFV